MEAPSFVLLSASSSLGSVDRVSGPRVVCRRRAGIDVGIDDGNEQLAII